jgi:hypothetical protein
MTPSSSTTTQVMLTTKDNPYDPFKEYDEWYSWDLRNGYHTPSLLARVAVVSYDLSEAEQQQSIRQAIDEIVDLNPSGMHIMVTREVG